MCIPALLKVYSRVVHCIKDTLRVIFFLCNAIRVMTIMREVRSSSGNSGKFGKFSEKPVGRNFREFRESFSGDSREFRKSRGTFPEIWGFFPERALWSSVPGGKTG